MTQKTMYATIIGDESTTVTSPFNAGTDTLLKVEDTSFLPAAPNRLTLKRPGELYLVVLHYTAKTANTLTVQQTPIQGKPTEALTGTFPIGSVVSKPLTQDDIQAIQDNIRDLDSAKEPKFTKNGAFNKNFGNTSGTVCQGNDARLSDARPPTAHATTHKTGGSDVITPADIGAEPAITKKTAFNKDFGTASGTVCEGNDSRLNNARTPTAHAATHGNSGTDKITIAESQVTNLTTDLAAKVNINQGTANAGKYLAVGADGNVTPIEVKGSVYGFNIPYGSKSDNLEYTDDAAGMDETQRRALVQSWAKHAVVKDGVIQYWLDESDLNKKVDGTASVLDGTDGDVMLMYRPIWWRIYHENDKFTKVQFADWDFAPGKTASAHRYGDIICSHLGLGVFEGIILDSVLRSINTASNPTTEKTNNDFYNAAVYGRNSIAGVHYNQKLPLTWTLHAILLLFEGGNRNVQVKWGRGVVDKAPGSGYAGNAINEGWNATTPWARNNNSGTSGVTAGGIHNPWGNIWEFLGEFLKETNNIAYFTVKGGSDHQLISTSGHPSTWASVQMTGASNAYVADVIGDNNLPFLPRTTGASDSTHWADYCYSSNSRNCGIVGGSWSHASKAGLFYVYVNDAVGHSARTIGARLQVLIE